MDTKSIVFGALIGAAVMGAYPLYRKIVDNVALIQVDTYTLVTECTSLLDSPLSTPDAIQNFLAQVESNAPKAATSDAFVGSVAGTDGAMGRVLQVCVVQLKAKGAANTP